MEVSSQLRFAKPRSDAESTPTRYLFVAGLKNFIDKIDKIKSIFGHFGALDDSNNDCIEIIPKKRYFFIVYKEIDSAVRAYNEINGRCIPELDFCQIFIKFAEENVKQPPPVPECTSTTKDIFVPGLTLTEKFITELEEKELLEKNANELSPWVTTLFRRVQHFGYTFSYETLLLDSNNITSPIPDCFSPVLERFEIPTLSEAIDQMTVNEYMPGQGIAPHIDTMTCFGPDVYIISCGSGVTMTFTLCQRESEPKVAGEYDVQPHTQQKIQKIKKHLWLPPRSLLHLTGPARNIWTHQIASRTCDMVDGVLLRRGRRVSFTFRKAVLNGLETTIIPITRLALKNTKLASVSSGSSSIPSRSNFSKNLIGTVCESDITGNDRLRCPVVESAYVHQVYDSIAVHWHHTRGKRKVYWQRVKTFIDEIPPHSLVADIGCGDGKYLDVNPQLVVLGCDRSLTLLQVSRLPTQLTFCCDAVQVPLRSGVFDAAICIALLHHLSNIDRRAAVIAEVIRILRPGARALVQAWAQEQEEGSCRTFAQQDVLVPWHLQSHFALEGEEEDEGELDAEGRRVFRRYCHMYREGELESICRSIDGCLLLESGWDRSNWFVVLEKSS